LDCVLEMAKRSRSQHPTRRLDIDAEVVVSQRDCLEMPNPNVYIPEHFAFCLERPS
jgi:hypothetical protein